MQRAVGALKAWSLPFAGSARPLALLAALTGLGYALVLVVTDLGGAMPALQLVAAGARRAIAQGYAAAPALVLGIAFLLTLPAIAALQPVVRYVQRSQDATRRYRPVDTDAAVEPVSGDATGVPGMPQRCSAHAFLEVVGVSGTHFAILRDMLRIGREDDNDIRIPSTAVHRYHAAIYREHSDDWHIADLSGREGNGIRVNGQRCCDARLADGDIIELGPGRLRFRTALQSTCMH